MIPHVKELWKGGRKVVSTTFKLFAPRGLWSVQDCAAQNSATSRIDSVPCEAPGCQCPLWPSPTHALSQNNKKKTDGRQMCEHATFYSSRQQISTLDVQFYSFENCLWRKKNRPLGLNKIRIWLKVKYHIKYHVGQHYQPSGGAVGQTFWPASQLFLVRALKTNSQSEIHAKERG